MRIATWNVERPTGREPEQIEALHARMRAVNAEEEVDVWILTETHSCISPGNGFQCRATTPITGPERYAEGENRTTIWSRLPIRRSVPTHDPETAVCAEIECGGKSMLNEADRSTEQRPSVQWQLSKS